MAWTFSDEIHAMTGYDADGTDPATSAETLVTHTNQWLVDGAREVINNLPTTMYEKCSGVTAVTSSSGLNLGTSTAIGKVLYVTRKDGTYEKPCRLLSGAYGDLADDSTAANHYAVASDPAYFIRDNTVFIKPTPGSGSSSGFVYHIVYPTITNFDGSNAPNASASIKDFPDDAEHLVVLYAAQKVLQYKMSAITNGGSGTGFLIHSDQDGTYSASSSSTAQGWERVRGLIEDEDIDLSSASISALGAEMQQFVTEYSWYSDQYTKLQAQYVLGIGALKGT